MTFSTPPRCFLGDRECFAYDAVSWKLFAGTFRTNLSQVRLETYLVGLAMDSLKRQARWNQRLDFLWHKEMRFRPSTCGTESFATEKRMFGPKMSNALDCHDSRHLYKPSAGSCLHKPGHTKDEGWNYRLAVPHLKLQMKLVDLLRCRLGGWALGKNRSDFHLNRGKFTKNTNDHWSSAAGLSMPRYTKPWHRTHRLLPCIIRELRQVCWNVAGLWFRVFWGFRTLQIPLIWLPATLNPDSGPNRLHNATKSCSRQTTTSPKRMVSSLQAAQRSFSTPPFPLAEGPCFA